jgi:hypothetical protein
MGNNDEKEILDNVFSTKQENPALLKICQIVLDYLKGIVDLGLKKEISDTDESILFENLENKEPPFREKEERDEIDEDNPITKAKIDFFEKESQSKQDYTDEEVPKDDEDERY